MLIKLRNGINIDLLYNVHLFCSAESSSSASALPGPGLTNAKVTYISSSLICCTVVSDSGKDTWMGESIRFHDISQLLVCEVYSLIKIDK